MMLDINDSLDILLDVGALSRAKGRGDDMLSLFVLSTGDIVASDSEPLGAVHFLCLMEVEALENGLYEEYSPQLNG